MFETILIANRGEIAARVMTTARRLGIRTVAVHSDADAASLHVAMADEAVRIGPPPVAQSYLAGERIIEAALRTRAQAIHPGYGFLSENPGFVERVEAAGLAFIGPPAPAIRAMGLKDAAKVLMEEAGVPVVPGYHGAEQDPAFLAARADEIGYPVLIKARAGGGGKGMRLVLHPEEFALALAGARREAEAAFGDGACLVERFVARPRHIEIQIFADAQGRVLHLFERDCSLQRRHQKVIEEAPAPGMTAAVRAAMGRAAVEAARAIGYVGAGTVEFIADGSQGLRTDGFWFMEMNTRLQVEHPVTEAITGLDLVEWQIRVAAGEPLPFEQADLAIDGHAFEARIYAEDAPAGFLPAIGRLEHLAFPAGTAFERGAVRIDSGVRAGDRITPFYDPMIAKLIVHGPDRARALASLRSALAACRISGTVTNIAFLHALARHPGFAAGEVDTGLIGRDQVSLTAAPALEEPVTAVASLLALGFLDEPRGQDVWDRLKGWQLWSQARHGVTLAREDGTLQREIVRLGAGRFRVEGGAMPLDLEAERLPGDGTALRITIDGHARTMHGLRDAGGVSLFENGHEWRFTLPDLLEDEPESDAGGDVVSAPMPGLVKLVRQRAGDAVEAGEPLIVLEAMKMEHTLVAPRDGVVGEVLVTPGEQVGDGAILLRLASEDGDG